MDSINKLFHLRDTLGFPIPSKGITAAAVERLPAIIHDHARESNFSADPALLDDRGGIHILVVTVPR